MISYARPSSSNSFNKKWSQDIAQYSFTQIPNLLLNCQGHLGITDNELITLIHLIMHWYRHEGKIFPSIETLSSFSQKGYSTIQKKLRTLENKGFICRDHIAGRSNCYDIQPLIDRLHEHQKMCSKPPRKRRGRASDMGRSPPSYVKNEEYEVKRRSNNKPVKIDEIVKQRAKQFNIKPI